MAVTAAGTPYVESSDNVADYPGVSLALANHIDATAGKIVQVVSTHKTDTFTVSAAAGSVTDVTGLQVVITPSSASNKIMVMWNVSGSAANVGWATVVKRGGAAIGVGDAAGAREQTTDLGIMSGATSDQNAVAAGHYLDSPSATTATTYQIAIFTQRSSTQVLNVNLVDNDGNNTYIARSASNLTVMEVSA